MGPFRLSAVEKKERTGILLNTMEQILLNDYINAYLIDCFNVIIFFCQMI